MGHRVVTHCPSAGVEEAVCHWGREEGRFAPSP